MCGRPLNYEFYSVGLTWHSSFCFCAKERKNVRVLFLLEREQQLAYEGGVLAVLVNGHGLAVEVLFVLQLLEVGVGVAAQHQVNATRLLDEAVVGILAASPS